MLRIAVVGSRKLTNYNQFEKILLNSIENLLEISDFLDVEYNHFEIVSGGASGADAFAKRFAKENNLKYTEFPANWDKYGKAAGPIRNKQIAEYSDMCIAIYYKEISNGTKNCVNCFQNLSKRTCESIAHDK